MGLSVSARICQKSRCGHESHNVPRWRCKAKEIVIVMGRIHELERMPQSIY